MSELFQAGLTVTLMGMGVVFVLLTMLVCVVQVMSRIISLIEGDTAPTIASGSVGAAAVPQARSVEREIVSVAAAAIQMYRGKRRP